MASIRSRDGDVAEIAFAGTACGRAACAGKAGDRVVLSLRPEALRVLGPGECSARRMGDACAARWARSSISGP